MKKIAILLPAMRMGGAEKAFLNCLDYLIKDYEINLILNKKEGDLLEFLPENIKIIEDELLNFTDIFYSDLKNKKIINIVKDIIYYAKIKLKIDSEKNYRYLISRTPKIKEKYHCVICYVANVSTQIFSAVDRVNAYKKIAWIHGETTELKDTSLFEKCYKQFDKIYCVSNISKEHFVSRFNSCKEKVDVYYNHINKDEIIEKSKGNIEYTFDRDKINIVSVGRLSSEKGFDMIPEIIKILDQNNYNIKWYLVGEGFLRKTIEEKIKENNLKDKLILTGNQINPYPFMKNCDIYVQPSYEEGYGLTIIEAAILGKPIIATNVCGVKEHLLPNSDYMESQPNAVSLYNSIKKLIDDIKFREELITNIKNYNLIGSNEYIKLKKYIN